MLQCAKKKGEKTEKKGRIMYNENITSKKRRKKGEKTENGRKPMLEFNESLITSSKQPQKKYYRQICHWLAQGHQKIDIVNALISEGVLIKRAYKIIKAIEDKQAGNYLLSDDINVLQEKPIRKETSEAVKMVDDSENIAQDDAPSETDYPPEVWKMHKETGMALAILMQAYRPKSFTEEYNEIGERIAEEQNMERQRRREKAQEEYDKKQKM